MCVCRSWYKFDRSAADSSGILKVENEALLDYISTHL